MKIARRQTWWKSSRFHDSFECVSPLFLFIRSGVCHRSRKPPSRSCTLHQWRGWTTWSNLWTWQRPASSGTCCSDTDKASSTWATRRRKQVYLIGSVVNARILNPRLNVKCLYWHCKDVTRQSIGQSQKWLGEREEWKAVMKWNQLNLYNI